MGLSKKEAIIIAEELGKVQIKEDRELITDFLLGVIPLVKTTAFDEQRFREEVEYYYQSNYGN